MGCSSCKSSAARGPYEVVLPGKGAQVVATEADAQQLTKGVRGAYYRPKR